MGKKVGANMGEHVAFRLAEAMFTREFFLLCSWTGQSTENKQKFALQKLEKLTEFFRKVVHNCDDEFNSERTKKFFQSLMNKSKHRVEDPPKASRKMSAPKKRPKNLKYNIKNKKMKTESEKDENLESLPTDLNDGNNSGTPESSKQNVE